MAATSMSFFTPATDKKSEKKPLQQDDAKDINSWLLDNNVPLEDRSKIVAIAKTVCGVTGAPFSLNAVKAIHHNFTPLDSETSDSNAGAFASVHSYDFKMILKKIRSMISEGYKQFVEGKKTPVAYFNYDEECSVEFSKFLEMLQQQQQLEYLKFKRRDVGKYIDEIEQKLPKAHFSSLEIYHVNLGKTSPMRILQALPVSTTSMSFYNCSIDSKAAENLATVLPKSNIKQLILVANPIGNEGAKSIITAAAAESSQITALSLRGCGIDARGVGDFAPKLTNTNLTELDLSNNGIGDDGVKALVENLPKTIQILSLRHTGMTDAGLVALSRF